MLLPRCTHVRLDNGKVLKLTGQLRSQITSHFKGMAKRPLRCLALAVKEGRSLGKLSRVASRAEVIESGMASSPKQFSSIESNLVFVGICGIKDPARPEVGLSLSLYT